MRTRASGPSAAKKKAYRNHWRKIRTVQDELSRQYIHTGLRLGEVSAEAQLSHATVARFFHFGRYGKHTGYRLFAGPSITTIVGIADAIGLQMQFVRRPNGKSNGSR